MNVNELIRDYSITVESYLNVSISKFLNTNTERSDYSERAFFLLVEEPVYSIIRKYTEELPDWKNIYDDAVFLGEYRNPERRAKSFEFMKKRGFPLCSLEVKISALKGLTGDEFYQAYSKITEFADVINNLFDNISFMVVKHALVGNFSMK